MPLNILAWDNIYFKTLQESFFCFSIFWDSKFLLQNRTLFWVIKISGWFTSLCYDW